MDWIWDNAVLVAFLIGLVAILVSLLLLALRGWRLYKDVRGATASLNASAAVLSADVQRVTDAVNALPRRQADIQTAIADVQRSAAALGILAGHLSASQKTLMGPLKYIGR